MQRRPKPQAHGMASSRRLGSMGPPPPPPVQVQAHHGVPDPPTSMVQALPQLQQASVQVALSRVHSHTRQPVRVAARCP
jgi:hypothetical protein